MFQQSDNKLDMLSRKEEELNSKIERLQKELVNKSLANAFPSWDLNPPAVFVKRKGRSF